MRRLAPSTDYALTGTRSLKITKLASADASNHNNQLMILIPFWQGQDVFFSGQVLAPQNIGTGSSPVYYSAFKVPVVGRDSYGRPVFGKGVQFRGEADIYLDLTGAAGRPPLGIGTVHGSPQAAAWTTHLALVFDTQVIPTMSFYLDGLRANVL